MSLRHFYGLNTALYWTPLITGFLFFLDVFKDLYLLGVRSLHGAEHKTIITFKNYKRFDFNAIKAASPIADLCGGRFFVLNELVALFAYLASYFLAGANVGALLAIWFFLNAAIFLIPTFLFKTDITLHPPVSWLARLFQRHFSVSEPSDLEIYAAQCALPMLLQAHGAIKILTCENREPKFVVLNEKTHLS